MLLLLLLLHPMLLLLLLGARRAASRRASAPGRRPSSPKIRHSSRTNLQVCVCMDLYGHWANTCCSAGSRSACRGLWLHALQRKAACCAGGPGPCLWLVMLMKAMTLTVNNCVSEAADELHSCRASPHPRLSCLLQCERGRMANASHREPPLTGSVLIFVNPFLSLMSLLIRTI